LRGAGGGGGQMSAFDHLNSKYAWAGASESDKAAVAAIYKRFEGQDNAWADLVGATWESYEVHAYYVTAGRDVDRAVADIEAQVAF
jgi:hypothetical protein